MLTLAPLPRLQDLARAAIRPQLQNAELTAPWTRAGDVAGILSRSAWSIALIALWRARLGAEGPVTIWVPDYFCNDALAPLRRAGVQLEFYPVLASTDPDVEICRAMLEHGAPDIVILVHYFGRPAASGLAFRNLFESTGAWLVEDAAHVLRPIRGVGMLGDFILYSPHKHLPLPDGAVLVARRDGPSMLGEGGIAAFGAPETWPSQLGALVPLVNELADPGASASVTWLARRLLQRLGARAPLNGFSPFAEDDAIGSREAPRLPVPGASTLALRLLGTLCRELGNVACRRQRHLMLWDTQLLDPANSTLGLERCDRPDAREWTPYLACYRIPAVGGPGTFASLKQSRLPVTTWPDLPPEVVADQNRHKVAWQLRHARLFLPVHQSLQLRELLNWRSTTPRPVRKANKLALEFAEADRLQWQNWFGRIGQSNLLQEWEYGDAKARTDGWHVERRVFRLGDEPIAIVQCLRKRIAGFLTVVRINRGPLELRELNADERTEVYRLLGAIGCATKGRVLSIAPELRLNGPNLRLMHNLGFWQVASHGTESIWIDLSEDLDSLRDHMRGSWRKAQKDLDSPERKSLLVDASYGPDEFSWMMDRYVELMRENDFGGTPVALMRHLYTHGSLAKSILVMRATRNTDPIAGICMAVHGAAATYMVGWSGPAGRKTSANQVLLWSAVQYLKKQGLRWFDLGGVDEEATPGISAFKIGLGGERYELVGEYLKW